MFKRVILFCFMFLSIAAWEPEGVYADDRVVLRSITSGLWYDSIYLIADRLSWVDYRNFSVQIGDYGSLVYNFPNWHSGKYPVELLKEDINDDTEEDIIIVLNNDAAGPGKPIDEIHILNKILDPFLRYEEAPIEPMNLTASRDIKIKQNDNILTITADKKKYDVDISKYTFYTNPHNPFVYTESIKYSIKQGKLIATVGAYVLYDKAVTGGLFGNFDIQYRWEGKMYKPITIVFKNYIPHNSTY